MKGEQGDREVAMKREMKKAGDRIRTYDPLITNQLLYQLSYTSTRRMKKLIYIK